MAPSPNCRPISINGSNSLTGTGRIKDAGVSARRRCKPSLTQSPLRRKKRSLPDDGSTINPAALPDADCQIKSWLVQIFGTTFARSTKTYNAYGLVATSTDRRGYATGYQYDAFNLYVATTTNP